MSECIIFDGAKDKDGYGVERYNGNQGRAHRNAYIRANGEIPSGMFVCHTCDNPSCVNPEHLFLGTPKQNSEDMVSKDRQHKPKGEINGMHKLKEPEVIEIKKLLAETDLTQEEIASIFNCSRQTITLINTGDRWGHV